MTKKTQKFDIVVVGSGPAGLVFAKSLADTDLKVAVIEASKKSDIDAPPYDGRETALTHFSYDVLKAYGVFDQVDTKHLSYIKRAHVINGDESYALQFDHKETGEDTLGYMMANTEIRTGLIRTLKNAKNISWFFETKVTNITANQASNTIETDGEQTFEASLVVGADGRFSKTRDMMNVQTSVNDLKRTCVVGVMNHTKPHNDTAFECFHYERTLAVLPLNDGRVSIVITAPTDKADDLLNMPLEDLAKDLAERFEHRVGDFSPNGKLHPYPLVCTYANQFYAQRFALLGDAAVGMHPMTAHGYNLGLRGAYILAQEIKKAVDTGHDIGSEIVLKRYNRKHQLMCRPIYLGTNVLERLFTNETKPVKAVRKALLRLGNIVKPARKLIMSQLTDNKIKISA